MATLAVRPLTIRDLPGLRFVRQRQDVLDPDPVPGSVAVGQRHMLSVVPFDLSVDRGYAAFIDGELCATALLRPEPEQFRWKVIALSAGSPRLAADDDVCEELWTALLEYSIRGAGEAGAKRLFAAIPGDGPSHRSLRATGFEPYARRVLVCREGDLEELAVPAGFRRQEPSDVWSVHQLYHQVTPRAVQAAEAFTSSVWELPHTPAWSRILPVRERSGSFVVETREGIEAFLRVEARGNSAVVEWMSSINCQADVAPLVFAGVREVLGASPERVFVSIPEYAVEVVWRLEQAGFTTLTERIALVRHTTAPALVHPKLAPVSVAESAERVPRGVPSYYRYGVNGIAACERSTVAPVDRTERREH